MSNVLKPCPFCGGEVMHNKGNDNLHQEIECKSCRLSMFAHWLDSFEYIKQKWNTRVNEPPTFTLGPNL